MTLVGRVLPHAGAGSPPKYASPWATAGRPRSTLRNPSSACLPGHRLRIAAFTRGEQHVREALGILHDQRDDKRNTRRKHFATLIRVCVNVLLYRLEQAVCFLQLALVH